MNEVSSATGDQPARSDRRPTSAVVSVLCAAGFVVVLALVAGHWPPLHRFDVSVANQLNAWVAPRRGLTTFWKVVTTALQPLTFEIAAAVGAALLWWRGSRWLAGLILAAIFGTVALYDIFKVVVDRPRPSVRVPLIHPYGESFPSGHAAMSASAMLLVVLLARRWLRSAVALIAVTVAAGVVAVAVAFSRLALGAHYVSDVIGAWLMAAAWVLALNVALGGRAWSSWPVSRKRQSGERPAPDRPPPRSAS